MAMNDRQARYSAAVALLNSDRIAADNPTYVHIGRISDELAGRTVHGVKVQRVPRSTANDVLRGVHKGRLRWEVAESVWAVIHYIAEQRGIDIEAMTSLQELKRAFHRSNRPGTAAAAPAAAPPARSQPADPRSERSDSAQDEPAASRRRLSVIPGRTPSDVARSGTGVGRVEEGLGGGAGLLSPDSLTAGLGTGVDHLAIAPDTGGDPRQAARQLLDRARRGGPEVWWYDYRSVVPNWFAPYLTLERELSLIRIYAPLRVPGLLEAPSYARHVIVQDLPGISADELERRVELRQVRQQVLHRPDPPSYWAIIDQRALSRRAAPPTVLREQLKHLISMAAYPHVTVQLVHSTDAERLAPTGPITLMRFPEHTLSDIIYFEHHDYGHYVVDDLETIKALWLRYNRLGLKAMEPHDSVTRLLEMLDRLQP